MKFNVSEQFDSGGQGTVWRATEETSGDPFAIKFLKPNADGQDPAVVRARFLREVRCQSELRHPNIVPVVDVNATADPPWYAMPIANWSLRDLLKMNSGGLGEAEALRIFDGVLEGMQYAHSEGVYHRDLKPENILMYDSVPKVSDFGLSRQFQSVSATITHTNIGLGTVHYGAPEQFENPHTADHRADIFSLGKILYEMLCGKVPFPYFRLDNIPAKYRFVVGGCTHEEVERRYQSVAEMRRELQLLSGATGELRSPKDHASVLLGQFLGGTGAALPELNRVLLEHTDDQTLYLEFVPYLPQNVIDHYAAFERDGLIRVVKEFDGHASGGHAWSFTDVIADFLQAIYRSVDDYEVQNLVLRRVLRVGADHNRYYVRDVFVSMVEQCCRTDQGAILVARVLREEADTREFVSAALLRLSLPRVVRDALA